MKVYTFTDDSYYTDYIYEILECYNSDDVNFAWGSAHTVDGCYMQAIATELNCEDYYEFTSSLSSTMTIDELEDYARSLNITIEII